MPWVCRWGEDPGAEAAEISPRLPSEPSRTAAGRWLMRAPLFSGSAFPTQQVDLFKAQRGFDPFSPLLPSVIACLVLRYSLSRSFAVGSGCGCTYQPQNPPCSCSIRESHHWKGIKSPDTRDNLTWPKRALKKQLTTLLVQNAPLGENPLPESSDSWRSNSHCAPYPPSCQLIWSSYTDESHWESLCCTINQCSSTEEMELCIFISAVQPNLYISQGNSRTSGSRVGP